MKKDNTNKILEKYLPTSKTIFAWFNKEKRRQYIGIVRSQEERFSAEFSDIGIEYIARGIYISYDWIIAPDYALYKDYVADVKYEERIERQRVNCKYFNTHVKVTVYYITIKTIDNTEYHFTVDERYHAERMMTWFDRKKHERNKKY